MAELIKTDKELLVMKHSKESYLGLSLSGERAALHGCQGSTPEPVLFSSPPPFLRHLPNSADAQREQGAPGGVPGPAALPRLHAGGDLRHLPEGRDPRVGRGTPGLCLGGCEPLSPLPKDACPPEGKEKDEATLATAEE